MSEPVHISEPLFAVMKKIEERMTNPGSDKPMIAYVDGAAEPTNPGPMGAGYVLQGADGRQVEARGFFIGTGSCNIAEYAGLVRGVEAAIRHGVTSLVIYSDSQLIVYQVRGSWSINAEHLRACREKAVSLLNQVGLWSLNWIPREKNCQADVCAHDAAVFKHDVDYTGREIIATETGRPDHKRGILAAAGDYQKRNGGKRL